MPNIEFEDPNANFTTSRRLNDRALSFMVMGLINTGLVKDSKQANVVLILIAIASTVLAIFIVINTFSKDSNIPLQTPDFIKQMNVGQVSR
ncbi:MAG: hypothetical protein M3Q24_01705 [bacterium]|nr:hypothetical protein [bacterium]